jgi:hypothetical protein
MTTLERTLLAYCGGYVLSASLGVPNPGCVATALLSAFVPAYLGGVHLDILEWWKNR